MPLENKQYSWPWVTTDTFEQREWVHFENPKHYVSQDAKTGLWTVTDRDWDLACTKGYKTKAGAVKEFVKRERKSKGLPPAFWIRLKK